MMKTFNINDHVLVKLTTFGKLQLMRQNNEFAKTDPFLRPEQLPKEDENGYTKFQMHNLMSRLGEFCSFGSDLPFETNIKIETK